MLAASLLTLLSAAPGPSALVEAALNTDAAGRVEVLELREAKARGCTFTGLQPFAPPTRSGVLAVTLVGQDAEAHTCTANAVARVRVYARVLVTARAVKAGEVLDGAVTTLEREQLDDSPRLKDGELPAGATATQALAANTPLTARHVHDGVPQNGELVRVVVSLNGLRLVQEGHATRCATAGSACARLPNGHRVEGSWHAGELEVSP